MLKCIKVRQIIKIDLLSKIKDANTIKKIFSENSQLKNLCTDYKNQVNNFH
jgi:hypothetical protein